MLLLVNPPSFQKNSAYLPLPLLLLASFLEGQGFEITIEDINLEYKMSEQPIASFLSDWVIKLIRKYKNCTLFGFTSDYSNLITSQYMAMLLKKAKPNSTVIFGGPHPTVLGESLLKLSPWIDFVIKGYGEEPLYLLLKKYYKKDTSSFCGLPSLVFRKGSTVQSSIENSSFVYLDYDASQVYSQINLKKYDEQPVPPKYFYVEGGRGCNGNCTYCAAKKITRNVLAYRPPSLVYGEMCFLNKVTSKQHFWITMDNLASDQNRFQNLLRYMKLHGNHFTWKCYSRVESLSKELILSMGNVNCREVFLGIESYDERKRLAYNKGITDLQLDAVLKCLKQNNISAEMSFIIEPHSKCYVKEIIDTFSYCLEKTLMRGAVHFSILDVFIDTPLFSKMSFRIRKSNFRITTNEFCSLYRKARLGKNFLLYPEIYSICSDATQRNIKKKIQSFSFLYKNYYHTLMYIFSCGGIDLVMDLIKVFENKLSGVWYLHNASDEYILKLLKKVFETFQMQFTTQKFNTIWKNEHAIFHGSIHD